MRIRKKTRARLVVVVANRRVCMYVGPTPSTHPEHPPPVRQRLLHRAGRRAALRSLRAKRHGRRRHHRHVEGGLRRVGRLEEHGGVALAEEQAVRLLGPHHAVHGLVRRGPDRADGVDFLGRLLLALVARRLPLPHHHSLAHVPRRARVDHGLVRRQAHLVDVPPRVDVVERVEHHGEALLRFGARGLCLSDPSAQMSRERATDGRLPASQQPNKPTL